MLPRSRTKHSRAAEPLALNTMRVSVAEWMGARASIRVPLSLADPTFC